MVDVEFDKEKATTLGIGMGYLVTDSGNRASYAAFYMMQKLIGQKLKKATRKSIRKQVREILAE